MQLWYEHLPGSLLIRTEKAQIDKVLSSILGENLLQIGGPLDFSSASPIRNKVYLAHHAKMLKGNPLGIVADCTRLPILTSSLNVILLIHVLEFIKNPPQLLSEVYQALSPSGQIILLSFNACSFWGLAHLWKRKNRKPWNGHFYTTFQVKHWLRQAGFRVVNSESFYFRPPVEHHPNWDKHLLWLEAAGQLCLPACGSIFLISAQKREIPLTPIKVKPVPKKIIIKNSYVKQAS